MGHDHFLWQVKKKLSVKGNMYRLPDSGGASGLSIWRPIKRCSQCSKNDSKNDEQERRLAQELFSKSYINNNVGYLRLTSGELYSRSQYGDWFCHHSDSLSTPSERFLEEHYGRLYPHTYPKPEQHIDARDMIGQFYMKNDVWYLRLTSGTLYSRSKCGHWFYCYNKKQYYLPAESAEHLERTYGNFYGQTSSKSKRETTRSTPGINEDQIIHNIKTMKENSVVQASCSKQDIIYAEPYNGKMYGRDSQGHWFEQTSNVSYGSKVLEALAAELEKKYTDYHRRVARNEGPSDVSDGHLHPQALPKTNIETMKSKPKEAAATYYTERCLVQCSYSEEVILYTRYTGIMYVRDAEELRSEGDTTGNDPPMIFETVPNENGTRADNSNFEANGQIFDVDVNKQKPFLNNGTREKETTNEKKANNCKPDVNIKLTQEEQLKLTALILKQKSDNEIWKTDSFMPQDKPAPVQQNEESDDDSPYQSITSNGNESSLCMSDVNSPKLTNDDEQIRKALLTCFREKEETVTETFVKSVYEKERNLDSTDDQSEQDSESELTMSAKLSGNPEQVADEENVANKTAQIPNYSLGINYQKRHSCENCLSITDNSDFESFQEDNSLYTEDPNFRSSQGTVNQISTSDSLSPESTHDESFRVITIEDLGAQKSSENKDINSILAVRLQPSNSPTEGDLSDISSELGLSDISEENDSLSTDFSSIELKEEISDALRTADFHELKGSGIKNSVVNTNTEVPDSLSLNLKFPEEDTLNDKCGVYHHEERKEVETGTSVPSTEKASRDGPENRIQQRIAGLARVLREKYDQETAHLFPWHSADGQFPEHMAFEFETVPKEKETYTQTVDILGLFPCPKLKILVTGNPGFGKSTLCSLLAARWAKSQEPMRRFDLCLSLHLGLLDLNNTNVLECILLHFKQLPGSEETDEKQTKEVFKRIASKTILILDGFDDITPEERTVVLTFIKSDTTLQNSTVLLTSRTTAFGEVFNYVLCINGFSYKRLEALLFQTQPSENTRDDLYPLCPRKFWKLQFLSGLSPFMTFLTWRAVKELDTKDVKLFDILDVVMYCLGSSLGMDDEVQETLLTKLGKLCYEALIYGYSTFSEELLKEMLGNLYDVFSRSCIFWKTSSPQGITIWYAGNKVIVQYLAARFLRTLLLRRNDENGRNDFVKNVLCVGIRGCGEFVTCDNVVYQVGLIPDVVMKNVVQPDGFLLRTIEMLQDTQHPVEISTVFESSNLLLRTDARLLDLFSFVSKREEESLNSLCGLDQCFQNLLNHFTFEEYNVDYEPYFNRYENRNFLKVLVSESEDNLVLSAIFRQNDFSVIDHVSIEFSVRNFNLVLKGLVSLFNHFFPKCDDLKLLERCTNFGAFVQNAALSMCGKIANKFVVFECFGNIEVSDAKDFQKASTLSICVEPKSLDKTRGNIRLSQRGLIPGEHIVGSFNPNEFREHVSVSQEIFDTFLEGDCDHTIAIKIFDSPMEVDI